jgi:hypothetical protein
VAKARGEELSTDDVPAIMLVPERARRTFTVKWRAFITLLGGTPAAACCASAVL